ncbi:MAG: hypothetical protein BVN28_10625 [Nitrospira sp. ST-bin4]|nr:MAG: hypothetical protein BVN28_10625 [Nitrospira sp. ST-bin4]
MRYLSTLIGSRLAWCRLQRKRALTKDEAEKFRAEEAGLLDALHERTRNGLYGQDQRACRERYEIGLHDGQALMNLQRWNDVREQTANINAGRATSLFCQPTE